MYKKRRLAVMIGMLAGSTSVFAQTDMTSIEARLAAMEQRLQAAETRAQVAEKRATDAEQKTQWRSAPPRWRRRRIKAAGLSSTATPVRAC